MLVTNCSYLAIYFFRYVVRAKAGKRQSGKDATGKVAHSAGSSLRRYNEAALKKVLNLMPVDVYVPMKMKCPIGLFFLGVFVFVCLIAGSSRVNCFMEVIL